MIRPLYWSVRRELWEHRSIYMAPAIAAGVVLFGFLLGARKLSRRLGALAATDPSALGDRLATPYNIVAILIILTTLIVAVTYCLGALHGERRDRSLLFWKSLPVSDLTTVLAKAGIPLVVLPVVALVVVFATQMIMLLVSTAVLAAGGGPAAAPWTQIPWPRMVLGLIYLLAALALWYAPVYAWLLLVSGWAKRTAFLWAFLPPIALCVVEKIAFDTSGFAHILVRRLTGVYDAAFSDGAPSGATRVAMIHGPLGGVSGGGVSGPDPVRFLGNPELWIGLAVAAAFLAAAVWQRRRREPL